MTTAPQRPPWLDDVEPVHRGPMGSAWRFPPSPEDDSIQAAAAVGDSWLLFAPSAHPFWSWHVMAAVSLKDVPGQPPAHKRYPEAEYELLVMALNPDVPAPDPRRWPEAGELAYLTPPDAVVQFHDVPDGEARVRWMLDLCARAVCDGHLVPDSDHRTAWENSIRATLEHSRDGRHPLEGASGSGEPR